MSDSVYGKVIIKLKIFSIKTFNLFTVVKQIRLQDSRNWRYPLNGKVENYKRLREMQLKSSIFISYSLSEIIIFNHFKYGL